MASDRCTGVDAIVADRPEVPDVCHDHVRRQVKVAGSIFRFGIEEEYFFADVETMQVPLEVPERLFQTVQAKVGDRVGREFLQPQAEAKTVAHINMGAARSELYELRHRLAQAADDHGLAILAAGTHPLAAWREARQTPKERYAAVMAALQMIGRRNMLCGMHVHVELPEPNRRIDVMRRMLPYIPLLLALSTSSPFWQSQATGLKGYRLAAYDELPRTGLPELFETNEEYDSYIEALVRSGVMEDSSYIWWAIRPSQKLPTLELRAPDACTNLDDSIAIAALYRTLVRHLYFNVSRNADFNAVARAIATENKWRAQRYGVHGSFATEAGAVTVADFLDGVIDATAADAEELGCTAEVAHCRTIANRGTSADTQLRVYESLLRRGSAERALEGVARWIAARTLAA